MDEGYAWEKTGFLIRPEVAPLVGGDRFDTTKISPGGLREDPGLFEYDCPKTIIPPMCADTRSLI